MMLCLCFSEPQEGLGELGKGACLLGMGAFNRAFLENMENVALKAGLLIDLIEYRYVCKKTKIGMSVTFKYNDILKDK